MLVTIARGKAGRLHLPSMDQSASWRSVFRRNEDLLTGVVFSRFRFLSADGLQRVMGLLLGSEYVASLGPLESIDFWPRLSGLAERSWVEPDVLMRFSFAHVLVEVKPPFGGTQSIEQWRSELEAFLVDETVRGLNAPEVLHFVALGNTRQPDGELDLSLVNAPDGFRIHMHCKEWASILRETPRFADESNGADRAVFMDWIEAFGLFGLTAGVEKDWYSLAGYRGGEALEIDSVWKKFSGSSQSSAKQQEMSLGWEDIFHYSNGIELEASSWD